MKPFANNIVVFFCTILTFAAQAAPLGKQLSHALGKLDDEIVGSAITTHSVDKSAIADWLPITFEYELKGQEVVTVCVPRGVPAVKIKESRGFYKLSVGVLVEARPYFDMSIYRDKKPQLIEEEALRDLLDDPKQMTESMQVVTQTLKQAGEDSPDKSVQQAIRDMLSWTDEQLYRENLGADARAVAAAQDAEAATRLAVLLAVKIDLGLNCPSKVVHMPTPDSRSAYLETTVDPNGLAIYSFRPDGAYDWRGFVRPYGVSPEDVLAGIQTKSESLHAYATRRMMEDFAKVIEEAFVRKPRKEITSNLSQWLFAALDQDDSALTFYPLSQWTKKQSGRPYYDPENKQLTDAWGNEFQLRHDHELDALVLISLGPNGQYDKQTGDDIVVSLMLMPPDTRHRPPANLPPMP